GAGVELWLRAARRRWRKSSPDRPAAARQQSGHSSRWARTAAAVASSRVPVPRARRASADGWVTGWAAMGTPSGSGGAGGEPAASLLNRRAGRAGPTRERPASGRGHFTEWLTFFTSFPVPTSHTWAPL